MCECRAENLSYDLRRFYWDCKCNKDVKDSNVKCSKVGCSKCSEVKRSKDVKDRKNVK